MTSFPESDTLTLWLGLALVFAIEVLVVARLLTKIWAVRAGVRQPRGVGADRTAERPVRACVLALAGVAILLASPALAEGTCLIEVDGQRSLDGPCAPRGR
jgi:hypothetical protein